MSVKVPTARETSILHYIAWGYTNKEVATQLAISVKTVEAHKANAMRKLMLRNRIDIVKYAIEHGWLVIGAFPDAKEKQIESSTADVSVGTE